MCSVGCSDCCLNGKGLCCNGHGVAYHDVEEFYGNYGGPVKALRGAKKILAAVERDIKKSEQRKK